MLFFHTVTIQWVRTNHLNIPGAMLHAGDTNMNKTWPTRGYRNQFRYSNHNTKWIGQNIILRSNKTNRRLLHAYYVPGTVLGILHITVSILSCLI